MYSYANTDPMRYCGEYHDPETGFIYLRARYYDPTIGRFASEDPHWNLDNMIYGDPEESEPLELAPKAPSYVAIAQSSNLYPYCANNPVSFADPDGESLIALAALAAITVGSLLLGGCAAPDDSLYNRGLGFAENFSGKGSTGRTVANNLNEQLAMSQVMSNPLQGATQLNFVMNDSRWLGSDGWVKMQNIVELSDGTKINIHFVYNTETGEYDDFKFVD